jgi:hypothetical protein
MYKPGDWNVICDRCGRKRLASELRYNWQNLFVCADTCWEVRHPQDFVKAIPDYQAVPIARPWVVQTTGETTVATSASKNSTSIVLTSVSGIADRDTIGIVLDDGTVHWTFSDGTPSGTTVTLGSYLPWAATAGNIVYLPSVNSETYTTASMLTATGL